MAWPELVRAQPNDVAAPLRGDASGDPLIYLSNKARVPCREVLRAGVEGVVPVPMGGSPAPHAARLVEDCYVDAVLT